MALAFWSHRKHEGRPCQPHTHTSGRQAGSREIHLAYGRYSEQLPITLSVAQEVGEKQPVSVGRHLLPMAGFKRL